MLSTPPPGEPEIPSVGDFHWVTCFYPSHSMDPYGTYVKTLRYKAVVPNGVIYENPPVVKFATAEADFWLADGVLAVAMKRDYATVPEAEHAIGETLRAWEALADLQYANGEFRFVLDSHDYAMRNPPPPGTIIVGAGHMQAQGVRAELFGTTTPPCRRAYPEPPGTFVLTPDAKTTHDRFIGHTEGREPITSMAYFCLTVLETVSETHSAVRHISGRRRKTAALYQIDFPVLSKLGELTGEHGGGEARKASATKPLTDAHRQWLAAVVKAFFVRVGEQASGAPLKLITMADLPQI